MSWRQYRALVVTFLRVAWRGPAGAKGFGQGVGRQARGFAGYLLVGAIMAFLAALGPEPRATGFLLQSMSFFMVVIAFLNIYGDLVFDARDVPLLFWRPLDARAYLAARFTAILVYFAAVTTALNLPGALVLGLRFGPVWYPAAHLLGAFVGSLAALVLALLLLFGILRTIGRERLRDMIAWVQIAVTFLFLAGNQLLARSRRLERLPEGAIVAGVLGFLVPMSWAQAVTDVLAARALPAQGAIAGFGVAASAGIGAILLLLFGRSYQEMLRRLAEGESRRERPETRAGILRRSFERAAAGDPVARAGFLLAWATIRRARDYKVRAISLFGLPVAFLVIALWPGSPGMAVMVPVLLAFAALSGLTALVGSEHAGAGWVWSLAPEGTRPAAVRGAALAVMGALVAPVLLLVGVATLVAWGPLRALGFVAFAAGLSVASLRWWQGHIRDFPCTVPLEEARRQSVGVEALALFLVGGMLTAIDAALNRALGAWTTPLLAAPMLVWGWRGLAARR